MRAIRIDCGRPRLWWALLCVLVIPGCAVRPPEPPPDRPAQELFEQRNAQVLTYERWRTSGRAAFTTEHDNATLSVAWRQQDPSTWQLDLRGPLGTGSVRLQGEADGVELRASDGTVETAGSARNLLFRHTGYDLPVDVLRDWLRGIPADDFDADVGLDAYGRPSTLRQLDWDITYTAWRKVNGVSMPERITLEGPDIRIRAVLRDWELNRD